MHEWFTWLAGRLLAILYGELGQQHLFLPFWSVLLVHCCQQLLLRISFVGSTWRVP